MGTLLTLLTRENKKATFGKDYSHCLQHIYIMLHVRTITQYKGRSGGAMVLGKLPVPGRPTIWITVGQGPTALAVGAGGGCFGHFYSPLSFLSSFSLSFGDSPI